MTDLGQIHRHRSRNPPPVEIETDGSRRTVAENLPIGLDAGAAGLPPPYVISGVAVSEDGVIYFSADRGGNGAIYRINPQY